MAKKFFVFILVCSAVVSSPQALSWGQHTHRVICDIAWRQLGSEAKRNVRKLLQEVNQKTFANACVWADRVKSNRRYQFTKPHHYINVRRSAKQINPARDCGAEGCVTEAVSEYIKVLSGTASDSYVNNRARALMFLGHFVGDLHQPLHVSFAEDEGGSETYVRYGSKKHSIHYLWDVTIPQSGLAKSWRKSGSSLAAKINDRQLKKWQQGKLVDWGNESLALTHKIYRDLKPNMAVQFRYLKKFYPDAEQRIMMAGVRLANILNDIYE